jgi:hypothetical protein
MSLTDSLEKALGPDEFQDAFSVSRLVVSREVFDDQGFVLRETEETIHHLTISPQSGKEYNVQSPLAIWCRPKPVMTPLLTGVELFTLANAPECVSLNVNGIAEDASSSLVLSQMDINPVLDLKPFAILLCLWIAKRPSSMI